MTCTRERLGGRLQVTSFDPAVSQREHLEQSDGLLDLLAAGTRRLRLAPQPTLQESAPFYGADSYRPPTGPSFRTQPSLFVSR